jgi:long-chain fatty acid transport protein
MTQRANLRRWASLALVAALTFQGTPLFASGFQLVEQNASGLGTAHSGDAAAAEDASTIFFNPAGMTRLKGKQLVLAINGVDISTTFADSQSTRPYLPTAVPTYVSAELGSLGGNAGGWSAVPNAYLSWQAADRVWVGVGANAPFGLPTEWEGGWMGRFHATKSDIKVLNVNPTIAFKVSDVLSIAGGANYQHLTAKLSQAVPYGGIAVGAANRYGAAAVGGILAQLGGPAGIYKEGTSLVDGSANAWGWNLGAMIHAGDKARFGVTYRSKVKHVLKGDLTFDGAPTFIEQGPIGPIGAGLNAALKPGPAKAEVKLPDTLSVAAAVQASDKLELLADWTWTGWSSIPALVIQRDDASSTPVSTVTLQFQDIWRAGLGVNYQMSKSAKLRLGGAYDKSPVQDPYRTPRLPDENRVWVAAGLQFKTGKNGAFDLGYARVFINDASSNLKNQETATSTPRGNLVGTYKESVNIVAAQYRISF